MAFANENSLLFNRAQEIIMRISVVMASLTLSGTVFASGAQAQLPPTQTSNGIQYVTGGVGQEESSAFKQARSRYALALTFAVNAPGSASSPYAGNVKVQLHNAQGDMILDTVSKGPYFLANLDPGTYKLDATYKGETQSKEVTIRAGKPTEMKLTWTRSATGPD